MTLRRDLQHLVFNPSLGFRWFLNGLCCGFLLACSSAQNPLEGLDTELLLALGPRGLLLGRLRTHDGEANLVAQLVVLALHARVVGALRDGHARYQIMIGDGRVDMYAAALAVGMNRDPARGVRSHFLAQEVSVLARPLHVLGNVIVRMYSSKALSVDLRMALVVAGGR